MEGYESVLDEYTFRKFRKLADRRTSFRCSTRNCDRLKVALTGDVVSSSEHNHEGEPVRNAIDKVVIEIPLGAIQKP